MIVHAVKRVKLGLLALLAGLSMTLLLPTSVLAEYDIAIDAYMDGNYKRALREFKESAKAGDPKAMFHLANMYAAGEGIQKSLTQAVKLYKRSAKRGYANAQYNLGIMYYTGEGVTKSTSKAVKWWKKAAEQKLPSAQFNLAIAYAKGEGVKKDYTKSYMWAFISAAYGNQQSKVFMNQMVLEMTLQQLNDAERMGNRWIDNH